MAALRVLARVPFFSGDRGRLRREILTLAWPVIIANFLQVLTTTVDLIMVGQLGVADIAAVGIGGNLVFFMQTVMIGVTAGTIALVARAFGAENRKEAEHFLFQSLIAGALLSVPLVVVGVAFAPAMVGPFSPTSEIQDLSAGFVSTIFLSMPFMFMIFISTAALRAAGDTKTPLIIGALENVINFAINYTLIFGNFGFPAMGVRGAATGTSISYTVGAVLFLYLFAKRRLRIGIRWERPFAKWDTIRRVLRIGLPAAAEQFAFQIGLLAWIVMVVAFGEDAVAAHQIGLRIQSFVFMPGLGMSVAATALVGQSLGARLPEEADRSAREATKMGLLIMAGLAAFIFVFAPLISYAFVGPGDAHDLSVVFIRIHATSIPAVGIFFTISGTLRGAGDTRWPLYASLAGTYLVRLPLSVLLGYTLGFGVAGVWAGLPTEYYLRALVVVQRFRGGAWKSTAV